MKKFLTALLNVLLVVLLADAVVSLLDDSLGLFAGVHALSSLRGILAFLAFIAGGLLYLLMGATPLVPKRFFLPLALFGPVAMLGAIPLSIFHHDRLAQIAWAFSWCQVILSLCIVVWLQGGFRFHWPLIREDQMGSKAFGWLNSIGFVLVNGCVVLPAVLFYFGYCGVLAVDHFSGSFLALRSDSLVVRARKYVRDDGRTIHLIPMMHIGESRFYQQISESFPTNSVILLEGVTDNQNLLKQKLTYKRVAKSLGLTEQQEEFAPERGRPKMADVDVGEFSQKSIEFIKLATRLHAEGLNMPVLMELIEKSQDPALGSQIWEDLLLKRNEHLLGEIRKELRQSEVVVVPWGAAHMRGIAEGIQKAGFHPSDTREFTILNFGTVLSGLVGRK
jgi:hypothetical protein